MKRLHTQPEVGTVLGLCCAIVEQTESPDPEVYLMTVVSALKAQLRCEMYTEAQLTAERADQYLSGAASVGHNNQAGMIAFLNQRLKVVHSSLVLNFGAFSRTTTTSFSVDINQTVSDGLGVLQRMVTLV